MREVSYVGTYLAVQWLRLCASTAWVLGLIPDQRTMSHGMAKKFKKRNACCVETFRVPQCLVLLQQFNFHCCHHWTSQVTLVVKNPHANARDARDTGSIPGSGRSPQVGNGTLLHHYEIYL